MAWPESVIVLLTAMPLKFHATELLSRTGYPWIVHPALIGPNEVVSIGVLRATLE